MVMYKIDRRGGGGSKNRSLGRTQIYFLKINVLILTALAKVCSRPSVQYKMSELGDSGDIKVPLICRLCASPTEDGVEIFSEKGQEICLPEKISKCLPVLVSRTRY